MSTQTALWEGNEAVAHERDHAQSNSGDWGPAQSSEGVGFFELKSKKPSFMIYLKKSAEFYVFLGLGFPPWGLKFRKPWS